MTKPKKTDLDHGRHEEEVEEEEEADEEDNFNEEESSDMDADIDGLQLACVWGLVGLSLVCRWVSLVWLVASGVHVCEC